jgi:hypothetical protein
MAKDRDKRVELEDEDRLHAVELEDWDRQLREREKQKDGS